MGPTYWLRHSATRAPRGELCGTLTGMPTYVALVRGINVGKAKQVSMADLAAVVDACGGTDVRTVLRSGNVVFTAKEPVAGAAVEAELLRRTGVSSSVLLIGGAALLRVAADNPLLDVADDPSRLMVGFTSQPPDGSLAPDAATLAPEMLVVGEHAVYQWCPDGVMASRVPASFWRQVAPVVTVRNWRTVLRLVELVAPPGRSGVTR